MNYGAIFGFAVGQAFAGTLIMFALCALALQSQRKAKLGWKRTFFYFVISLAIMASLNIVIFLVWPAQRMGGETGYFGIFQMFVLPFLVSAATLLLLWKPKLTSPANATVEGEDRP